MSVENFNTTGLLTFFLSLFPHSPWDEQKPPVSPGSGLVLMARLFACLYLVLAVTTLLTLQRIRKIGEEVVSSCAD